VELKLPLKLTTKNIGNGKKEIGCFGLKKIFPFMARRDEDDAHHPSLFDFISNGGSFLKSCARRFKYRKPLVKREQTLLHVFLTTAGNVFVSHSVS